MTHKVLQVGDLIAQLMNSILEPDSDPHPYQDLDLDLDLFLDYDPDAH